MLTTASQEPGILAALYSKIESVMNRRQRHWLEKFCVQLTVAGVLALVYFLLWNPLRTSDPLEPLTFLGASEDGRLLLFALLFWAGAAVCAAATARGRPEGAIIALLIGFGGLSLRSARIRSLLWMHMDSLAGVYRMFIIELLILSIVFIGGWFVVAIVRRLMGGTLPFLLWKGPDEASDEVSQLALEPGGRKSLFTMLMGLDGYLFARLLSTEQRTSGAAKRSPLALGRPAIQQSVFCFVLELAIAAVLLLALMRSAQRGQVLFGLFASSFLAILIANQIFPSPYGPTAWVVPIILGICFYALGAISAIAKPPQGWIEVSFYARALPIDWLTAGCGGAMLGYWVSARIHEIHRIERAEDKKES